MSDTGHVFTTWSLTFVAIVMVVGAVVAGVFGRETRGEKFI